MAEDYPLPPAGRKRSQPDPDPQSTPTSAVDSPAIKKRRYGALTATAPSPSTPKGFRAITSAIGNVLFGRAVSGQEIAPKPDADSLYDDIPDSGDDLSPNKFDLPIKYNKFSKEVVKEGLRDARNSPKKPITSLRKPQSSITVKRGTQRDMQEERSAKKSTPTKRANPRGSAAKTTGTVRGRKPVPTKDAPVEDSDLDLPSRSITAATSIASMPQLKGILSPQKKRIGTPRKSVAFDKDSQGTQEEIFFADLPKEAKSTSKKNTPAQRLRKATSAESTTIKETSQAAQPIAEVVQSGGNSEDDEVCVICSKPDSEPPNEILFCETCDQGYHQVCHNVPVIPEGDWICRNCSQEDAVVGNDSATAPLVVHATNTTQNPDMPNFDKHLRNMQRILLDRCSGNRRIKLYDQEESYEKAHQLLEQTVLAGEGNSMMVIGARGCGKTTLVETIISNLASEHGTEFHVVRLNGFIHTDDKLALKDIWRQLGKEMELEDDLVNKTSNYADTMASLLALLSHPTEITDIEDGVTSKSVVFIIDEFDLFATHARQTLLYNLFDIAQAKKAPIAVVGCTTRIDVVETLEKRVKSRFSHRYVYMSQPKTLPAFWNVCKQGLTVDEEDLEVEGFDISVEGANEFQQWWTQRIESFAKTPAFEDHLEYQYYATKSVQAFLTSWILPLSELSPTNPNLSVPAASASLSSLDLSEPKLQLLAGLSDLELAMLISAARLDIVAHTDTVNFAMAYDEYTSQMGKQRVQSAGSAMLALGAGAKAWGRGVAAVAWERLVLLGLLIPASIGARSHAAHAGLEGKMWKLDVSLEEIPTSVDLPGYLGKWCTQI